MKVLLAGATGTLGRSLSPKLRARGHEVLGLTRDPAKRTQLQAAGVEPIVADALDRLDLLTAVDGLGADAVIHELTALKKAPRRHGDMQMTNRLREEGTANLLAAASQLGATRFLVQSMIFGYGFFDHVDKVVTEADEFGPSGHGRFDRHAQALRRAEDQVLEAAGIDGVSLRYGLLYGADPSIMAMAEMLRRRRLPVPRGGGGVPHGCGLRMPPTQQSRLSSGEGRARPTTSSMTSPYLGLTSCAL